MRDRPAPTTTASTGSRPARRSSRRSPACRHATALKRTNAGRRSPTSALHGAATRRCCVIDASDRQALAGVGRARLATRRRRRRPPARDPAGEELHSRGTATSSCCATCARANGKRDPRGSRRSRAAGAHRQGRCERAKVSARRRRSTSPGTSPSPASKSLTEPHARTSATTPSPSSATQPRRPQGRRQRAPFTRRRSVAGLHGRRPEVREASRASRGGHVHGALLPRPARLPAGSRVQLRDRDRRCPPQLPGNDDEAHFVCIVPRARDAGDARAARRSTATACSASHDEVNAGQRQGDGERARLRLLRDRLGRHGRRRPRRTRSRSSPTSRSFPTLADRAAAGLRSTSSTSGG